MKHLLSILFVAACSAIASAQTPAKPAAPATAKPATTATHPAATGVKLPPGVPPARGILKTAFSLRYQDIKVGTGADAEPGKLYKVQYTGWLAADGHKFDSSYDHPRAPVLDKDGKPVLDADGKPKQGDPQPLSFPQGFGRLIPGWDQGFYGMKVGGKRRLFIPWQLAYGARGRPGPDAAHPGIPPKADLIFDVELVDISDFQMPQRPGMMPPGRPMPPGAARPGMPPAPGTPPAPGSTPAPAAPGATPAPGQPAAPAAPPQTSTPPKPATTGQPAAPATPPQPQTN
jgi:peptidylprolyl isomerase